MTGISLQKEKQTSLVPTELVVSGCTVADTTHSLHTQTDSDPCPGMGPCPQNDYNSHLVTGMRPILYVVDISYDTTVSMDQSRGNPY